MYFNGYDPITAGILRGVFRSVWSDLHASESSLVASVDLALVARTKITRSLLDAADNGERNPAQLKVLALSCVPMSNRKQAASFSWQQPASDRAQPNGRAG